jgi:hypothetical protein
MASRGQHRLRGSFGRGLQATRVFDEGLSTEFQLRSRNKTEGFLIRVIFAKTQRKWTERNSSSAQRSQQ